MGITVGGTRIVPVLCFTVPTAAAFGFNPGGGVLACLGMPYEDDDDDDCALWYAWHTTTLLCVDDDDDDDDETCG